MATLYFNGAVDSDWSTLGNWWQDEGLTIPATNLPTSADSVIALATISSNSGSAPTVVNFTLADNNFTNDQLDIPITVTGIATFNNGGIIWTNGSVVGNCVFNNSSSNSSVITGDCTFNYFSYQGGAGYITGNCIFNNNSTVSGTIVGNCTFNDSSYNNAGSITGDCTFNDYAYNSGTITGTCTFNDSSANTGTITGTCTFNDSSSNTGNGIINGTCTFNDSSSHVYGTITGDCTFNLNAYNQSSITGNCTLNNNSYNSGTITGDCIFNDSARNYDNQSNVGGTINGNVTFNSEYNDNTYGTINGNLTSTVSVFNYGVVGYIHGDGTVTGTTTFSSETPVVFNCNINFDDPRSGGWIFSTPGQNWEINGNAFVTSMGVLNGDAVFNDNSYNNGSVLGDATFNDSSYCGSAGTVLGDVICNDTSSYRSNIDGNFPENLAPASITCYDSSYTEIGYGASRETTCNYYNTSYNKGHIANSVFHDNSYNFADFPNGIYGYLLDSATFNDSSINYGFLGGPSYRTPTVVFNDYSMNNGPADSPNYPASVTFNHNSYNTYNIIVSTITFNNNSYSSSAVSAVDCNINGPKPIIIGAFNNEIVVASYNSNARIVIPSFSRAGLGVNGSNILGVI